MVRLSSKLEGRIHVKIWKRWQLFHATDFESLMYPSFTFCHILGVFPYKIGTSAFKISKPHYIFSSVITCVCFIGLLDILYTIISGTTQYKGVPRAIERNCFYILSCFIAVITYILSGPRMRLLQTIMEISMNLPSETYQKLSRLVHTKDILGSVFLLGQMLIYIKMDIEIVIKIFVIYIGMLMFQMDMLYMNCVCVLKACFERISDNLEHMRELMINAEVYHLGQKSYKERSPFLLIKLKALKKQHLMISHAVQMLNIVFSLQMLTTIIITFTEITFEFYFCVLYWQRGQSMIKVDNRFYEVFLIISIIYYFTKIFLIMWACQTGKNQALQIGTTVHDVLNSVGDNEIKKELQLFSLQILHRENVFSAKGLILDARLLTAIVGNISTYLLILMQFLNMSRFCDKEIATNVTEIIH